MVTAVLHPETRMLANNSNDDAGSSGRELGEGVRKGRECHAQLVDEAVHVHADVRWANDWPESGREAGVG